MAFTRNPSDTDVSPATYTATGASDVVITDQQRDIAVDGSDADDVVRINADALAASALYDYDVRGFAGKDNINVFAALIQDSTFNGNIGDDTLTVTGASLNGSFVLGGKDNDTINVFQVSDGEVNGNLGNDIITVDAFGVAQSFNASIRGGQGQDSISVEGGTYENSSIFGDKGRDSIVLEAGNYSGTSVFGGEDNDTIVVTAGEAAKGLVLEGNKGNDNIFALGTLAVTAKGGEGNDNITVGALAAGETASVTGGTGADAVTLNVAGVTSTETVVFDSGDSVTGSSSSLIQGGVGIDKKLAAGDTVTFGNGVDTITNFEAAKDKVDIDFTATGVVDLLAKADGTGTDATKSDVLAANTIYEVYGQYDATTGVFRMEKDTQGATVQQSLYIVGGGNDTVDSVFTNSTNMFVAINGDLAETSFI